MEQVAKLEAEWTKRVNSIFPFGVLVIPDGDDTEFAIIDLEVRVDPEDLTPYVQGWASETKGMIYALDQIEETPTGWKVRFQNREFFFRPLTEEAHVTVALRIEDGF